MTLDQVLEKQSELGKKKRQLEFITSYSPEQFAAAWLALAGEYAAIDSRANYAYCMAHYHHYAPVVQVEPAFEYSWQEAAHR